MTSEEHQRRNNDGYGATMREQPWVTMGGEQQVERDHMQGTLMGGEQQVGSDHR
jgi:hypothetical protein